MFKGLKSKITTFSAIAVILIIGISAIENFNKSSPISAFDSSFPMEFKSAMVLLASATHGGTHSFTGAEDNSWSNSANWSPSPPTSGSGDTIEIPNGKIVVLDTDFVNIGSTMNINGALIISSTNTLDNGDGTFAGVGTINVGTTGVLDVEGTLNNNLASSIIVNGDLNVKSGGILNTFSNSQLKVEGTGSFDTLGGGIVNNDAEIFFEDGSGSNEGTIDNTDKGSFIVGDNINAVTFTNTGTFSNSEGSVTVSQQSTFDNGATGVVNLTAFDCNNDRFAVNGNLENSNMINNSGCLFINELNGVFNNSGTLDNDSNFTVGGEVNNNGTLDFTDNGLNLDESGVINNNSGGTFTAGMDSTLNIFGTLTNSADSTSMTFAGGGTGGVNLNDPGTIDNSGTIEINSGIGPSGQVINDGTITINAGAELNSRIANNLGGLITNDGTLGAVGTSASSNAGTINNNDLFQVSNSAFTNTGTIDNSATIENDDFFTNDKTITNSGTIENNNNLESTDTINNLGGTINNNANLINSGIIIDGTINNFASTTLDNSGTINQADIKNGDLGGIPQTGIINNLATGLIDVDDGKTLTNNFGSSIDNQGTINRYCGGTYDDSDGGTLSGTSNAISDQCPTLSDIDMFSDNANDGQVWAKVGDTVTISFDSSVVLANDPVVKIARQDSIDMFLNTAAEAATCDVTDDECWEYTMTAGEKEEEIQFEISWTDVKGTAAETSPETILDVGSAVTFDKTPPTVIKLTEDSNAEFPALVNGEDTASDSDADDILDVTIDFSEDMNNNPLPTISFPNDDAIPVEGATESLQGQGPGSYTDNDTFDRGYKFVDKGITAPGIDIEVTGATDLAGNVMVPFNPTNNGAASENLFGIDTENPTVIKLTEDSNAEFPALVNGEDTASDSDADDILDVTIDFSEDMNNNPLPTISFPNDDAIPVEGATESLQGQGPGSYTDNDTFDRGYKFVDKGITAHGVDIEITLAQDLVGNVMVPFNPTNNGAASENLFGIDTENPINIMPVSLIVEQVTDILFDPDPATSDGVFDVTRNIDLVVEEDAPDSGTFTLEATDVDGLNVRYIAETSDFANGIDSFSCDTGLIQTSSTLDELPAPSTKIVTNGTDVFTIDAPTFDPKTTTITCTSTDIVGNTDQDSVDATVKDTTSPIVIAQRDPQPVDAVGVHTPIDVNTGFANTDNIDFTGQAIVFDLVDQEDDDYSVTTTVDDIAPSLPECDSALNCFFATPDVGFLRFDSQIADFKKGATIITSSATVSTEAVVEDVLNDSPAGVLTLSGVTGGFLDNDILRDKDTGDPIANVDGSFQPGGTIITYTAQDAQGNSAGPGFHEGEDIQVVIVDPQALQFGWKEEVLKKNSIIDEPTSPIDIDIDSVVEPIVIDYRENTDAGSKQVISVTADSLTNTVGSITMQMKETKDNSGIFRRILTGPDKEPIIQLKGGTSSADVTDDAENILHVSIGELEVTGSHEGPIVSANNPSRPAGLVDDKEAFVNVISTGGGDNNGAHASTEPLRLDSDTYFVENAGVVKITDDYLAEGGAGDLGPGQRILGTSDIVAYYKFEENGVGSLTGLEDSGPNGLDGTWISNGEFSSGRIGNGIQIDGASEVVQITDNNLLDFGTNSFTIMFWTKFTDSPAQPTQPRIINKWQGGPGWMIFERGGNMAIRFQDSTTSVVDVFNANIADDVFHHVAIVFDRENLQIKGFIDGIQRDTISATDYITIPEGFDSVNNSLNLKIGGHSNNGLNLVGKLDEVYLIERALTNSEISAIFADSDLRAHYKFEGDLTDSGPNGLDGSWGGASTGSFTIGTNFDPEEGQGVDIEDSTAQFISVSDNDLLDFGTNSFSIAFWTKYDQSIQNTQPRWMSKFKGGEGWMIFELPAAKVRFRIQDDLGNVVSESIGVPTGNDVWYHIGIVVDRDANELRFYRNGILEPLLGPSPGSIGPLVGDISSIVGSVSNSIPLFIGGQGAPGNTLDGNMDEIRIYSKALSNEEMARLAEFIPNSYTGLTAGYMDSPSNDDGTGNSAPIGLTLVEDGNTGIFTGTPSTLFTQAGDSLRSGAAIKVGSAFDSSSNSESEDVTFTYKSDDPEKDTETFVTSVFETPPDTTGLEVTGAEFDQRFGCTSDPLGLGSTDYDGDGICNEWENQDRNLGLYISLTNATTGETFLYTETCSGTTSSPGPDCPSMLKKDIYLELDYMTGHEPDTQAIRMIKEMFANAPVDNPGGPLGHDPSIGTGINLHVVVDDDIQEHTIEMSFEGSASDPSGFHGRKNIWFGTSADRAPEGATQAQIDAAQRTLTAKRHVYHYGLMAHNQEAPNLGSSGFGEIIGNDFLVTLGSFSGGKGSPSQQARTIAHELGHNLGLEHGGGIAAQYNCKPNYLSLMNYAYQFENLVEDSPIDYSRIELGTLDSSSLVEADGVEQYDWPGIVVGLDPLITSDNRDPSARTLTTVYGYFDPVSGLKPEENGVPRTALTGTPIDWNRSGANAADQDITPGNVNIAITNIDIPGCSGNIVTTDLVSHDDWSNLVYRFVEEGSFASGAIETAFSTIEPAGVATVDGDTSGTPLNYKDQIADFHIHSGEFSHVEVVGVTSGTRATISADTDNGDTGELTISINSGSEFLDGELIREEPFTEIGETLFLEDADGNTLFSSGVDEAGEATLRKVFSGQLIELRELIKALPDSSCEDQLNIDLIRAEDAFLVEPIYENAVEAALVELQNMRATLEGAQCSADLTQQEFDEIDAVLGGDEAALAEFLVVPVKIEVEGGVIDLASQGVQTVNIFSDSTHGGDGFDVTEIDVSTIRFEGAETAHELFNKPDFKKHHKNIDDDNTKDLVNHFRIQEMVGLFAEGEPKLVCWTAKTLATPEDPATNDLVGCEEVIVVSGNSAPTVTIDSITDSSGNSASPYVAGDVFTFEGTATDAEDGDISSQIIWDSSIDGALGTGASVTGSLSAGTHIITAEVTDSALSTTMDSRTITVEEPGGGTPPTDTLSLFASWETTGGKDATKHLVLTLTASDGTSVLPDVTIDFDLTGPSVSIHETLVTDSNGQVTTSESNAAEGVYIVTVNSASGPGLTWDDSPTCSADADSDGNADDRIEKSNTPPGIVPIPVEDCPA